MAINIFKSNSFKINHENQILEVLLINWDNISFSNKILLVQNILTINQSKKISILFNFNINSSYPQLSRIYNLSWSFLNLPSKSFDKKYYYLKLELPSLYNQYIFNKLMKNFTLFHSDLLNSVNYIFQIHL